MGMKWEGHLDKIARIRMTYETWERLRAVAKRKKVKPSAIIRDLIEAYLHANEKKPVKET